MAVKFAGSQENAPAFESDAWLEQSDDHGVWDAVLQLRLRGVADQGKCTAGDREELARQLQAMAADSWRRLRDARQLLSRFYPSLDSDRPLVDALLSTDLFSHPAKFRHMVGAVDEQVVIRVDSYLPSLSDAEVRQAVATARLGANCDAVAVTRPAPVVQLLVNCPVDGEPRSIK